MSVARIIGCLWAVALANCAGVPRVFNAWARPADVTPGPGRAQLLIESSGSVQRIGLTRVLENVNRGEPDWLCQTPCTLYARPGLVGLYTGGSEVRAGLTVVRTPPAGARVRLRAPSASAFATARAISTGGVLLGLIGTIFLIDGPIETAADSQNGPATIAVGAGLLAIGAALAIPGFRALRQLETGAESVTWLASGRP